MIEDTNGQKQVKTTHTTFDILELILEREGASTATVAQELDIADSTSHRHLATLWDRGYLVKEGNQYDIGSRFLKLGEYASRRREDYMIAQEVVNEIAAETKEQAHFFVEEHGRVIQVYTTGGEHAVDSGPGRGYRLALHSTAAGKAILSQLSEPRVNEILHEQKLQRLTDETITDPVAIEEELATVRDQGYSTTAEEHVPGIHAIGVPVMDSKRDVLGALSVSGPAHRLMENERDIGEYLVGRAGELELNIGFSSGSKKTRTVDSI